jgi:hypothetical protein
MVTKGMYQRNFTESERKMKPQAYISDGGVIFKESPPDSILTLAPLYTSPEIQALHNLVKEQEKKIIDLAFDLEYARRTDEFHKLTEDEIREVADSVCHAWKKNGVGELYMTDFARAILRKASEK